MSDLHFIDGPATEVLSPDRVGGKAANLAFMARLGLPVPPAFVLPVGLCAGIETGKRRASSELRHLIDRGIERLEAATGRRFGDRRRPLLVSVRSGAARSMPGMLDTVLDVGATEEAVAGLVRITGNPRFARDCRRRFLEGWAQTVLGLDPGPLERHLAELLAAEGVAGERHLDVRALDVSIAAHLRHIEAAGHVVPAGPRDQLEIAVRRVFASWNAPKAVSYRRMNGLEDLEGTAVTVQAMVYGNADSRSAAGVAFSRDPSSGAATPVVELLFEAQGEDVVSGRRIPADGSALAARLPQVSAELAAALARLERTAGDVQDVEFTVESGRLWLLQTRTAKRTPRAALHFAVAFVAEGVIDEKEAVSRLAGLDDAALEEEVFVGDEPEPAGIGLAASPGVAVGRLATTSQMAERLAATGEPVVLVRPDTSTADIDGFAASCAVVTASGGRTSHAALVARQMGLPCVVACRSLRFDEDGGADFGGITIREGDRLSVDGDRGLVFAGRRETAVRRPEAELAIWRGWKKSSGGRKDARSAR
ncbi:MAG: PEP-utilizing enzyme [Siculibacillus sp.]|nr:PEP-utilizing enzyme [Siculibacillus sp.]